MSRLNKKQKIALCLLVAGLKMPTWAASLDSTVQMLAKDAAVGYLDPIASAFGSNLNAGWFNSAPSAEKFKFKFQGGLVAMGTFLGDGPAHFKTNGNFNFNKEQAETLVSSTLSDFNNNPVSGVFSNAQKQGLHDSLVAQLVATNFNVGISGATVIGNPDDSIRIAFRGADIQVHVPGSTGASPNLDTTFSIPNKEIALGVGGILSKLPILPLAVPHMTFGDVMGTQVAIRWLPSLELDKSIGSFTYFGFGVQHNPSVWLPFKAPLDFSAAFSMQRLGIGKLFTATSMAFGGNASKTFGWRFFSVTPYAGLLLEKSNLAVRYDYKIDLPTGSKTNTVKFDLPGNNWGRATAGLNLRLLILNLNADYSVGKYDSFSAGLMLAI